MQRQPHAFLLTILADDDDPANLHGRIRFVATGAEVTFSGVGELLAFIWDRVEEAGSTPPIVQEE